MSDLSTMWKSKNIFYSPFQVAPSIPLKNNEAIAQMLNWHVTKNLSQISKYLWTKGIASTTKIVKNIVLEENENNLLRKFSQVYIFKKAGLICNISNLRVREHWISGHKDIWDWQRHLVPSVGYRESKGNSFMEHLEEVLLTISKLFQGSYMKI